MPRNALIAPFELADAELDLVALNTGNIDVLRNAFQNATILSDFTIKDVASHNNLNVGAIIQALGGGAAILQRQTV